MVLMFCHGDCTSARDTNMVRQLLSNLARVSPAAHKAMKCYIMRNKAEAICPKHLSDKPPVKVRRTQYVHCPGLDR